MCAVCGLVHAPGELFVPVDFTSHLVYEDTCELKDAWAAARAEPQQPGTLAYHATRHPEEALERGLDPQQGTHPVCKHVCLAETEWIGAWVAEQFGHEEPLALLEVDVSGLDLFFELGEARHHGAVIEPERLRVVDPLPAPIGTGWSDPGWRRQHSDCLVQLDLPLSRRLLKEADEVLLRRWPYDGYDDARFRSILAELAEGIEPS